MAMMTGDRLVLIEVTGVCNAAAHQTNYSVKAPYSNMSSTIQRITRQGGKILKVTIAGSTPSIPEVAATVHTEEAPTKGSKSKKK